MNKETIEALRQIEKEKSIPFDLLIEARYSRSRVPLLRRANVMLERLRFQVRLCMEERLISVRQYEYIAEMVNEVGRMVGGWLKSTREETSDEK